MERDLTSIGAVAKATGLTVETIRFYERKGVAPAPPRSTTTLSGDPALFLFGGGWLPNKDSIRWFFGSIWDDVRRKNPGVTAHVYGDDPSPPLPSKIRHPSPAESRQLFCNGAILVVPLRVASGIRMKILEAWARGIPVVATPQAASGLDARNA